MKFTCDKNTLLEAVNVSSRAACVKSAVPALEGLLIEAGGSISISGYDLKTGITTTIPSSECTVEENGSIVLNAKLFGDIIRKLPEGEVQVAADEKYFTVITCEKSKFNIMGSSASDYPDIPSVDAKASIIVKQTVLRDMIAQTIFAVSTNEARPVHTGSKFEIENGKLTVVSVDGFRLALRREKIVSSEIEDTSFVVPGTALTEIEKIASADEEAELRICLGAKHIMFTMGRTVLISRRLEGEFLNYRQAVPTTNKYSFKADRRDLINAVDRISLIINDKLKSPVRCTFGDGIVQMRATTALGSANDECIIEGSADNLEIGFNNRYMLDALKAAPADTLTLKLNTGISPCIITSEDDDDSFLYMILPVRLKAGD